MAYKGLDSTVESHTFMDYSEIFLKLNKKGMRLSQLIAVLSLPEKTVQQINDKKPLSLSDEQKIREYLSIDGTFFRKEYYFSFPSTLEGHSDKWKAIELYEKMKAHNFTILVDRIPHREDKYKLIGYVNGAYYEKEDDFAYDTSAIIVLASYIEEYLDKSLSEN